MLTKDARKASADNTVALWSRIAGIEAYTQSHTLTHWLEKTCARVGANHAISFHRDAAVVVHPGHWTACPCPCLPAPAFSKNQSPQLS